MTHVSKRQLKTSDFNALNTKVHAIIGSLTKKDSGLFFAAFFTKAERIMLTKRLCAIALFHEGYSAYRVSKLLIISPSTANLIKLKYEVGAYAPIVRVLEKKPNLAKELLTALEYLLRAGLPPRGKGRWKNLHTNR